MSAAIINAVRSLTQLHGSLFHAAKELAHRADGITGTAYMSYRMLGWKCHQTRRTAINHIARLVALGIIERERCWGPNHKWGINKYRFRIPWKPAQMRHGEKPASTLPRPEERGKELSIEAERCRWEKALRFTTPGSDAYVTTLERVARLQALAAP